MSSTLTRLRAAVVGTGGIVTGSHLPALRAHSDRIERRAAVDVDPAGLDAFRTAAGAMDMDVEGYAAFAAMLEAVRPDLVLIGTPPSPSPGRSSRSSSSPPARRSPTATGSWSPTEPGTATASPRT